MNSGKCRCKSGHIVVSWSEREIDDWLYDLGYQTIYEPKVPTEKGNLIADWLILPQKGLDKPVIIEYWGLLREDNRAQWVEDRLPRYKEKKIYKEDLYESLEDYYYISIYPNEMEMGKDMIVEKLDILK
jgi:hypothetical protein|tara:strand:- start:171 stop:557 length:387 start_codon:yes stop_codon:yes gene_type:complete